MSPQAMEIDQTESIAAQPNTAEEEHPTTPEKGSRGATDAAKAKTRPESAPSKDVAMLDEEVETPPKESQEVDEEEDDSDETCGADLYYAILKALFKELDLYAQPEAGLLEIRKQILVYHYAARLFELRKDVYGALNGDLSMAANLPSKFQKSVRKLRKKLQEANQLERLKTLTEEHIFGHDHVIRFAEGNNLPSGAQECCVWVREKPHAVSDHVKAISPFRDTIKFHCFQNPLMLMEQYNMGLALSVPKSIPVAYLVVSPFLKKPELLADAGNMHWQQLNEDLREPLMDFIAKDSEGWRAFLQRRANIVAKGSLTIIQRVLRQRPNTEGMDEAQLQKLAGLQEEIEDLSAKLRKVEEIASRKIGDKLEKGWQKDYDAMQDKLLKAETNLAEMEALARRIGLDKENMVEEMEQQFNNTAFLEERAKIAEDKVTGFDADLTAARQRYEKAEGVLDQAESLRVAAQSEAEQAKRLAAEAGELRMKAQNDAAQAVKEAEDAKKSAGEAEKDARVKRAESELLACGMQEMLLESKNVKQAQERIEREKKQMQEKLEASNKQNQERIERAKEQIQAEMQLKDVEVQQAIGRTTEAERNLQEKTAEAERRAVEQIEEARQAEKELQAKTAEAEREAVAAKAQLKLKEENVETLMASNAALRAETTIAKTEAEKATAQVKDLESARDAARNDEAKARKELEDSKDEFDRCKAAVTAAQADLAKEMALKVESERQATEAKQAQRETAARLQIKTEEASALTQNCGTLHCEVDKLTNALRQEKDRAEDAERAAEVTSAQLDVKNRSLESVMATNAALRVSLVTAQSTADQASEKIANAEKAKDEAERARDAARETERELNKELQCKSDEEKRLKETIKEQDDFVTKAKTDVAKEIALREGAEAKASEAHKKAAEASAMCQVKTEEASNLANECAILRAEVGRLTERVIQADERIVVVEAAERAAKASLQLKNDDVERLMKLNIELRTEGIQAKTEATEANRRREAAESMIANAHQARDQAQEDLRDRVAEAESLVVVIESLRADVASAKDAEQSARHASKKAQEEARSAVKAAGEAQKVETEALAILQVKTEEAVKLTKECSTLRAQLTSTRERSAEESSVLRAEAEMLRLKSEASSRIVKALAASCEKLKMDLEASQRSKVVAAAREQAISESADARKGTNPNEAAEKAIEEADLGITLDDLDVALTQELPTAQLLQASTNEDVSTELCQEVTAAAGTSSPDRSTLETPLERYGRRLRSKTSEARIATLSDVLQAVSKEVASASGNGHRRLRAKTPADVADMVAHKRARTSLMSEATDAD